MGRAPSCARRSAAAIVRIHRGNAADDNNSRNASPPRPGEPISHDGGRGFDDGRNGGTRAIRRREVPAYTPRGIAPSTPRRDPRRRERRIGLDGPGKTAGAQVPPPQMGTCARGLRGPAAKGDLTPPVPWSPEMGHQPGQPWSRSQPRTGRAGKKDHAMAALSHAWAQLRGAPCSALAPDRRGASINLGSGLTAPHRPPLGQVHPPHRQKPVAIGESAMVFHRRCIHPCSSSTSRKKAGNPAIDAVISHCVGPRGHRAPVSADGTDRSPPSPPGGRSWRHRPPKLIALSCRKTCAGSPRPFYCPFGRRASLNWLWRGRGKPSQASAFSIDRAPL